MTSLNNQKDTNHSNSINWWKKITKKIISKINKYYYSKVELKYNIDEKLLNSYN